MPDDLIDYAALCSYSETKGLYYKSKVIGGKQRYFYARTPEDVFRKLRAALDEENRPPTFRDTAEEWERNHFPRIKENTRQCYSPALKRAVEELGERPVAEIVPAECARLIDRLAADGMSAKTVKTQKLVLKMIFDTAIVHDPPWLLHNPMDAVRVPRGLPKKKRKAPEDDVMKTIISRAGDAYWGLFALLLLCTGCRRGEALALTWGDIDLDHDEITVNKEILYTNGLPSFGGTKTEAGVRTVPLLPMLRAHLIQPKGATDADLIFPAPDGRALNENAYRRRWMHYCKDAGFVEVEDVERVSKTGRHYIVHKSKPTLTPHMLRHGFATLCFEAGIEEKDCQTFMGHTDIALTRQIYTDLRNRRRHKSAEKLAEYLEKNY